MVDQAPAEAPAPADARLAKATKAPKVTKDVTKKLSQNPTILEMMAETIASLKERIGSSQYAISMFVEDQHKALLPVKFKKLLLIQLRKLIVASKLTKVKNSYKIPAKPVPGGMKTIISIKPKSTVMKPNKSTAVKPNKLAMKPKPKTYAAKRKSKSAAAKPKTAEKSKSVAFKSKASCVLVRAAKTSVNVTPSAKPEKAAPVAAKKPKIANKFPTVKKAKK